jgi:hypothetical protein
MACAYSQRITGRVGSWFIRSRTWSTVGYMVEMMSKLDRVGA